MHSHLGLMDIVEHHDGPVPICAITGELDASNVEAAYSQLLQSVTPDAPGLVIDLTQTSYVDSAGVRILFEMSRRMRTIGQELRIAIPPDGIVRRVLILTALAEVVAIDDKVTDGVKALTPRG